MGETEVPDDHALTLLWLAGNALGLVLVLWLLIGP